MTNGKENTVEKTEAVVPDVELEFYRDRSADSEDSNVGGGASIDLANSGRVACLVCRESILSGARKCTHCDSFQDFRRWISLSASVLALLVALVSVLSVVVPDAVAYFERDYSRTTANLHAIENVLVNLVATNVGNKPSVFLQGELHFEDDQGRLWSAVLEPQFATIIVYPGATQNVVFRLFPVDHRRLLQWRSEGRRVIGRVLVTVKEYGESERVLPPFDISEAIAMRALDVLADSAQWLTPLGEEPSSSASPPATN